MSQLQVDPPRPLPDHNSIPHIDTADYNLPNTDSQLPSQQPSAGSSSPLRPQYSPITPKVQPVLPATSQSCFVPPENGGNFTFSPSDTTGKELPLSASAPQYIPKPPNLPFSSEDATDAIALKAAISTLQFQKKKAQDDLKALASIKQLALEDPKHFKDELAAGRLKEQRPKLGDIQAILAEAEEGDSDDEVVLGASRDDDETYGSVKDEKSPRSPEAEIPDSQPSQPSSQQHTRQSSTDSTGQQFPRIPGPQSVVRMPYVNWEKYGVVGEPLDALHSQQQKWPGSAPGFGMDRGREYAVTAPYSPWADTLDSIPRDGSDQRKDSGPRPSLTGSISEHAMSTRSRY